MSVLSRRSVAAGSLITAVALCTAVPAYAAPDDDANDQGQTRYVTTTTANGATVDVVVINVGTGIVSGSGKAGDKLAKPQPSSQTPFPASCGLFDVGGVQHCQCVTPDNNALVADYGVCESQPVTPGKPQPPAEVSVLAAVKEASATLKLPDGVPVVSPDPANNEWNMIPIGYPIWLTTTAPEKTSVSATQDGIPITITATRGETAFNSGESPGKVIPYVYCWSMTQRKVHEYPPNRKSPDCGYVYKNMGTYTITATTSWHLAWSAAGYTGTLDTTRMAEAAKPLVIGQLKSRIVAVGTPPGGLG